MKVARGMSSGHGIHPKNSVHQCSNRNIYRTLSDRTRFSPFINTRPAFCHPAAETLTASPHHDDAFRRAPGSRAKTVILLLDHNCGSCAAEIITRSLHVSARAMTLHGLRGLQTGESARHVSEDEEDVGWRGGETLT